MRDLNSLLEELMILSTEGHEKSVFAASDERIVKEYEADKAEALAKSAKSLEFVTARKNGAPVGEAENKARISKNYKERLGVALKKRYEAEIAKARHQNLIMRRDSIKAYLSALQSSMKLAQ